MKMFEMFATELFKENIGLRNKVLTMIEKHWSHLRHSLRGDIEIDVFVMNEIFSILEEGDGS